jgi:hypothetical protein
MLRHVLANADHLNMLWCMGVLAFPPVAQSLVVVQQLCVRSVGKTKYN